MADNFLNVRSMNKKEFDEYCLSFGLVQTIVGNFWYGYNYPFKYTSPSDLLIGFQISFNERCKGEKLSETDQSTIKMVNNIIISTEDKCCIKCCGFSDIEDSDEEIKKKIYKTVRQYEKAIGDFKQYMVKSKLKEIEGDFE